MKNIYDIAIIGGGTAGLTAAIYCCRAGKRVVIFEKLTYGGQIISSPEVANYPAFTPSTGYDFAIELHQQVSHLNVQQINAEVTALEKNKEDDYHYVKCTQHIYPAKAIIIATGTINKTLSLPNKEQYLGRGISFCAVCDGAFHKGKTVAVIGGGNTAIEEALYLSFLCKKVVVIQRGDSLTAESTLIEEALKKDNIEILLNTAVTALLGNENLEAIEILHGSQKSTIDISGLFVAIGRIPQNSIFSNLLALDNSGYIIADDNCHTSQPGIFAAGDCRAKELRQLVTAASDGAIAASEALKYLKKIELQ